MTFSFTKKLLLGLFIGLGCCATTSQLLPDRMDPGAQVEKVPLPERLEIMGPVDEAMSETFRTLFKAMEDEGRKQVVIVIDTPGGSIFDGMQMGNVMEDSKMASVCVVRGMAASMGSYLLQSCTVRVMTDESLIMMHSAQGGSQGTAEEIQSDVDLMRQINFILAVHNTKRSHVTRDEYLEKTKGKSMWWTNAEQSLALGFADKVVHDWREVL